MVTAAVGAFACASGSGALVTRQQLRSGRDATCGPGCAMSMWSQIERGPGQEQSPGSDANSAHAESGSGAKAARLRATPTMIARRNINLPRSKPGPRAGRWRSCLFSSDSVTGQATNAVLSPEYSPPRCAKSRSKVIRSSYQATPSVPSATGKSAGAYSGDGLGGMLAGMLISRTGRWASDGVAGASSPSVSRNPFKAT